MEKVKRYYAGIGSRSVPTVITNHMTDIAGQLEKVGLTLRSGNAAGSDQAFAKGVEKAQIWLPHHEFNYDDRNPNHDYKLVGYDDEEAIESVSKFHPKPSALGDFGLSAMARNFRQLMGLNEPDSEFVICWTPDGKDSGGTGQAIRIANHYDIPVFNLYNTDAEEIMNQICFMERIREGGNPWSSKN